MALTVTDPVGFPISLGSRYLNIRHVDFDTSYPTGGEPLTFEDLGFSRAPDVVIALPKTRVFEYDSANEKLKAYEGDYSNAADGPLVEVPNATDLSAHTDVVVLAIGQYGR